MIEQHRSYVYSLAHEIIEELSAQVDLEELIAYGNLGLVEAAERYDPRRGVAFTTFAYYRIRGAIYDGLRKIGWHSRIEHVRVRLAVHANDLMQTAVDDEQASAGNSALSVDDEIASAQSAIEALIPVYLLSLTAERAQKLVDPGTSHVEKLEFNELISLTRSLLAKLPGDDRQIIENIYFNNLTITELATRMGVHKSWVSRLHTRAIKHLRELMEQHGLIDSATADSARAPGPQHANLSSDAFRRPSPVNQPIAHDARPPGDTKPD